MVYNISSVDPFAHLMTSKLCSLICPPPPPISYHTLLTNFTQIGLRKNEMIQDYNLKFNKTLSRISEDKRPNELVFLGFYKNAIPLNVKYSIRTSQMDTLEEEMTKDT
jgi:hypothetical protein